MPDKSERKAGVCAICWCHTDDLEKHLKTHTIWDIADQRHKAFDLLRRIRMSLEDGIVTATADVEAAICDEITELLGDTHEKR